MRRPRLDRLVGRWAAFILLAAAVPGLARAQSRPVPAQPLVPAQFSSKQDALGFSWDFDGQMVRGERSQGFRYAGMLQVNGSGFSTSTQPMMTADATEYVMSGNASNVQVTRRIKFDQKNGTVRFLETFQNPTASAIPLSVQLTINMMNPGATVMVDSPPSGASSKSGAKPAGPPGASFSPATPMSPSGRFGPSIAPPAPGALGEKDSGLLVLPQPPSSAAVLLYLAGPRSPVKPSIRSESSNYQLSFTYSIVVPPQKTISLVHGIAQRRLTGPPDAKSLAKLFAPFKAREWTRDLPQELRGSLANLGRASSEEEMPAGPLLQAVLNLAEEYVVERGAADVLVQDRDAKIAGKVEGTTVVVAGPFGPATVPLGEVAAIMGGAGIGQGMRVYLRNGEILCGQVELKDMILKTDVGLTIPLDAQHVHLLFLRADPRDSQPAPSRPLLATHSGNRLALAPDSPAKITGLTPWGTFQVPLADVRRIVVVREPQPMHRFFLQDGSRLFAILTGNELELTSVRFGAIKLPTGMVAGLEFPRRPEDKGPNAKTASSAEEPSEDGDAKGIGQPYCQLAGNNLVVGTIDAPQLKVVTPAGVAALETNRLRSVEAEEDREVVGQYVFEFSDGNRLVGQFADPIIPIRALGKVWQIPVQHLVAYRRPVEKKAEEERPSALEGTEEGRTPAPQGGVQEPMRGRPLRPSPMTPPLPPPPPTLPTRNDAPSAPPAPPAPGAPGSAATSLSPRP